MALQDWFARSEVLRGAPWLRALAVSHEQWRRVAQDLAAARGRLVALWASGDERTVPMIRAAFLAERRGLVLSLPIADPDTPYPGLEDLFPVAERLQRALADLSGLHSTAADTRPWLRHVAWPRNYRPLIDPPPLESAAAAPNIDAYEFVRVEGDGVHEIAVGPVHAGTIEPGHFRFSVVGEKVLRLEERLGYTHKGIAKRFEEMHQHEAHRLAARIAGDSAVAFSWAYCAALEASTSTACTPRVVHVRALALEHQRL